MKETQDMRRRPGKGNDTDITSILIKKSNTCKRKHRHWAKHINEGGNESLLRIIFASLPEMLRDKQDDNYAAGFVFMLRSEEW